jgi:LacI family transcriptional regulator
MEKNGLAIPAGYVINSDFEFQGGYSAMKALLALASPPQAVFTSNDAMAVGVYHALFEAGLRIPQDMAVMGYDDIELARYLTPPLTTIHQPKDELGQLAIDTLIHRLNDPDASQQTLVLTPELVVRAST